MARPGAQLRQLLARDGLVIAPGAYDGVSARLVEQAGFDTVYMTGYGTVASLLGVPDVGLATMSEMVDQARRMVAAVGVPVIADADTGYGNPINVTRTVQEYERAGIAALHIEDQTWPKRCGNMEGKQVIPLEDMVQKVRAAVGARRDPDLLIIARTDARDPNGIEDAIQRGRAYAGAGADVIFVEGPRSTVEIEAVGRALASETLLLFNASASGKVPPVPFQRLCDWGFKLVILPTHTLYVAARAVGEYLLGLKTAPDSTAGSERMLGFDAFNALVGLGEISRLEQEFAS